MTWNLSWKRFRLTDIIFQVEVFRVVTPCAVYWRWRQHGPLKRRHPTTTLHGVTTQKNSTRIFTAAKTCNHALNINFTCGKCKSKIYSVFMHTAMKSYEWLAWRQDPTTSVWDESGRLASRFGHFIPRGTETSTYWVGGRVGPKIDLDAWCPCWESKLWLSSHFNPLTE
jgi:hypothetical protein